jgi:hypothetical protein
MHSRLSGLSEGSAAQKFHPSHPPTLRAPRRAPAQTRPEQAKGRVVLWSVRRAFECRENEAGGTFQQLSGIKKPSRCSQQEGSVVGTGQSRRSRSYEAPYSPLWMSVKGSWILLMRTCTVKLGKSDRLSNPHLFGAERNLKHFHLSHDTCSSLDRHGRKDMVQMQQAQTCPGILSHEPFGPPRGHTVDAVRTCAKQRLPTPFIQAILRYIGSGTRNSWSTIYR